MTAEKLLPCPFCGSTPTVGPMYDTLRTAVQCPRYGCASMVADRYETAIAAWNKRTTRHLGLVAAWRSSKRHAEEWMKLRAAADEHEWIRQRCERAGDLPGLRAATELAALARAEECHAHAAATKADAELAAMLDALEAEVTP